MFVDTRELSMKNPVIAKAIEFAGSQRALAEGVGVTQQLVSYWLNGGEVRPEYCSDIERFLQGKIDRASLRPTDFTRIWPELAPGNPDDAMAKKTASQEA